LIVYNDNKLDFKSHQLFMIYKKVE